MNTFQDITNLIGASILSVAVGFTTFFIMVACHHAGHHRQLEMLFQLPLRLRPVWMPVFCGVWFYWWLKLWGRLPNYIRDAETARKMHRMSWAILALIIGLWVYLPYGQPHIFHFIRFNPGIRILWKAVSALMGISFPIILLAVILVMAADLTDMVPSDPLKRELSRKIKWNRRVNHRKFFEKAAKKGLTYLGYEVTWKKPVYLTPKERNEHIHVVGTTGSGKTRYVLFPMLKQDIEAGKGIIFIDAKASEGNALAIQQMATKAGREKDLLVFSLSNLDGSHTYNPLRYGDASMLKDKIMATVEWSESYYKGLSRHVLQSLFMELDLQKKRVTIPELYQLIQDKPATFRTFRELTDQESKDITNVRNELGSLVNTHFVRLLSQQKGDIDLVDAYKNKKIIYFALDTQSYQDTAASLGRIITQDIKTASGIITSRFKKVDLKPMAVYIDEFQAFGTRGFVGALSQCREAGFCITIAHQSLGDLEAIDPAYAHQVNDSTNTKVFLRVNDPDTAQHFCDSVGTDKKIETTKQVHLEGQSPDAIMGTQRVVHEYLIHPTELKHLETGQAVYKCGRWYGRVLLPGYFEPVDDVELPGKEAPEPETPSPEPPPKDSGQENHEDGENDPLVL